MTDNDELLFEEELRLRELDDPEFYATRGKEVLTQKAADDKASRQVASFSNASFGAAKVNYTFVHRLSHLNVPMAPLNGLAAAGGAATAGPGVSPRSSDNEALNEGQSIHSNNIKNKTASHLSKDVESDSKRT